MNDFWNFANLISYPTLPVNANPSEYFWFQLPFAVPGMVTLFTGLFLAFFGIHSGLKKENKSLFRNFAQACFGYAMLGLVLALRAGIQDRNLLLELNNWLYIGVVLLSPASYMVIFHLTGEKYRALLWYARLSWLTVFAAVAGCLLNQAFTGEWLSYSFGNYPVSSAWLKPWGVVSGAGYIFLVLPIIILELRKERNFEKVLMLMGLNLIFLLTLSNLPSFLGYPLFPGANFSFIPMLMLAYAVFRSDFLNLHDLFYTKNGLFYSLNALLGVTFFAVSSAAAFSMSPETYPPGQFLYWNLVPLVSAMGAFALGILVGGANPSSRVNQLGSFSLYLMGFLLMGMISMNLGLKPIIGHRLQQLAYIVFSLSPAVMFRFAFATMDQKPPRIAFFFDLASLFFSALAMSPYLFRGYFLFGFGALGAAGPVLSAMGFVGLLAISVAVYYWFRTQSESRTPLARLAILSLALVAVLMLLNIPAAFGLNFYPGANLLILPLGLLAYGVLQYGVFSERTQALRIIIRLSSNGLLIIPLFSLLYYPTLTGSALAVGFHMVLVLAPLFLLIYQMNFILSRPIAEQLDTSLSRLAIEKNQADNARREIERLSNFTRQIHATTDHDRILRDIFNYIHTVFHIETIALLMVDESQNKLFTYQTSSAVEWSAEAREYMSKFSAPLTPETGSLFRTYKRQKSLYLRRNVKSELLGPVDQAIIDKLKFSIFLQVPLVIQGNTTAIACFCNYETTLALSQSDVRRISRFCDQIAGSINNSFLLRESQEARNMAEVEGLRAKKSEEEIRKLNEVSRQINSKTNLHDILDDVFSYIISEYNIEALILQLVDRENQELYSFQTTAPNGATEEMIEYSRKMRVPLEGNASMISLAYHKKKPLYLKKLRKSDNFPFDQQLMQNLHLKSFLLVPLIIQGEVIAMAMFTSYDKKLELTRKEIHSITGFCDQIAGAIQSSSLLDLVEAEKEKSDKLLHNILPDKIADELKTRGHVVPQLLDNVSVMFTDFKNFTQGAAHILPNELMAELDGIFLKFDEICERNNIEKLKTIGDSYMCAGGLPEPRDTFALDIALTALEIMDFMTETRKIRREFSGQDFWELRIGIHSGPVIAGVIGKNKFAYDVWGDTVNIASRMETSGTPGRINISEAIYLQLKDFFDCEHRGQLEAKNKGHMDMYYLKGIKPDLSLNRDGRIPNEHFKEIYRRIHKDDTGTSRLPLPIYMNRDGW